MEKLAKLLRVQDWFYFVGLSMLGYISSAGYLPFNMNILKVIVFSFSCLGFAFSLNQFFDHPKEYSAKYLGLPVALSIISLVTSYLISQFTFLLMSAVIIMTTLYSHPSTMLKSRRFLATIINPLSFALLFLMGYSSYKVLDLKSLFLSFLILIFMGVAQLLHEMEHSRRDRTNKIMTSAVTLGAYESVLLIEIMILIILVLLPIIYLHTNNVGVLGSTALFSIFSLLLIDADTNISKKRIFYRYGGMVYGVLLATSLIAF